MDPVCKNPACGLRHNPRVRCEVIKRMLEGSPAADVETRQEPVKAPAPAHKVVCASCEALRKRVTELEALLTDANSRANKADAPANTANKSANTSANRREYMRAYMAKQRAKKQQEASS